MTERIRPTMASHRLEARIRELIAAETWPDGWDGDEPVATTPLDKVYADGSVQPLLFLEVAHG